MISSLARAVFCWVIAACVPLSTMAADGAMLYAKGAVTVDGSAVNDSVAALPGSVIETKPDALATLNLSGTTVTIQPDTLVKFQSSDLFVDHGSVTVASSSRMRVHVKCVVVTPNTTSWTQFEVADVNGTIQVVARKGDVGLQHGTEFNLAKITTATGSPDSAAVTTIVEGSQYNRYERQGCPIVGRPGGSSAGSIPIQDLPAVRVGAASAATGILIWVFTRGESSISPTNP